MKPKNRSILLTLIIGITGGITIGLVFSIVFSYLYVGAYHPSTPVFMNKFDNQLNAITISVVIWGLMGVVFSLGSLVFRQESWGITKQAIVHFAITYLGFSLLALSAHWFPINVVWLVMYTLIFILIYLIIWSVQFMIGKRYVKQINRRIKHNL